MQNKFDANEWFIEKSNDENVPNKSEELEGNAVNTTEKPVVWESYEEETEEAAVLNNENTTADSNTKLTKKRQGIKFKAWQILSAVLVVVIVIMSVLIFTRNKPAVAVDSISTSESQDEQLPEISESISENTQEENSDETENNGEDSAEADEKAKENNVTNKSENSVNTTKRHDSSSSNSSSSSNTDKNSNTSKSKTEAQLVDSDDNTVCITKVIGKSESVARQELKDFNIITEYCYSDHTPSGCVIDVYGDNSPSHWEEKGSTITMDISMGKGDDAWSEWSETPPTGSDIAYLDDYDSDGVMDGKGILVERKYCCRHRTVYKDRKGNIVEAGAWSEFDNGSAYPEFVSLGTMKNGNYGYIQQENVTFYRWRIDYMLAY